MRKMYEILISAAKQVIPDIARDIARVKSVFTLDNTLGLSTGLLQLKTRFGTCTLFNPTGKFWGVWRAYKSDKVINFHFNGYAQLQLDYSITERGCQLLVGGTSIIVESTPPSGNYISGYRWASLDLEFKDLDSNTFNSIQNALTDYDIDTLHEILDPIFYEKYLVQHYFEVQHEKLELEQEAERISAQFLKPFILWR